MKGGILGTSQERTGKVEMSYLKNKQKSIKHLIYSLNPRTPNPNKFSNLNLSEIY